MITIFQPVLLKSDQMLQHLGKSSLSLIVLLSFCLSVGCSGGAGDTPSGDVSGTVMFDGKPIPEGKILFLSKELGSGGSADLTTDGTFTFPGPLPVGEYQVYLAAPGLGDRPPSENPKADAETGLTGVPKKYLSETTTDLIASVKKGKNEIPFELKP